MNSTLLDDGQVDAESIILPYKYIPRDYQLPLWHAAFPQQFGLSMEAARRFLLVWHRRAGKDKTSINLLTAKGMEETGNYLYMLPEQTQARKIIWHGIGADGMRFIDHIPQEIIRKKYNSEMLVELINGSTIQLGGSDAYDSWMGTNPRGIVFSEFSLQDPQAWHYFRPILVENRGWAVFIYTPRGHNHGYELYKIAKQEVEKGNTDWFYSNINVEQSTREDGSPVITQEDIQAEVDAGMPPEMVRQEFYNSFDAGVMGSYYGDLVEALRNKDKIGHFPHDPRHPVITAWDLGISDATSIWFAQNIGGSPRIIEYYEERNLPLTDHIRFVLDKPYHYLEHLAPHDIEVREMYTGNTRRDIAMEHGLDFTVVPKLSRDEGIAAVMELLPTCTFDKELAQYGIEVLMGYERAWNEKTKCFMNTPSHNWASHGADAFRMLAVGWTGSNETELYRKPKVIRSIRH